MVTGRTPTSDKAVADLTKVITAGKPFTRAELAKRFKVRPDRVSDVVARLKREGWQVEMTRTAFQGPVTFVVTPPAVATAGGTPREATAATEPGHHGCHRDRTETPPSRACRDRPTEHADRTPRSRRDVRGRVASSQPRRVDEHRAALAD
jgi:hypothetical protein